MSFVSKLFEGKPDHPMFDVAEAKMLLAKLPNNDALKALGEITAWLVSVRDASGFKPELHAEIIMLLDETGQPHISELLKLYLGEPHLQDFEGLHLWHGLHDFIKSLSDAYNVCLQELRQVEKPSAALEERLPIICVRAIRAVADQMKIELMHYVDIEQVSWKRLFDSYKFAAQNQIDEQLVFAYPRQSLHISPLRELLRALMLHVSSPSTLSQDQIELCSRISTRMANSFDFKDGSDPDCPYYIDLDKPCAPEHVLPNLQRTASMRFFGATQSIPKISAIISQHTHDMIQQEQRFGNEFSPTGKLTVLRHLLLYWSKDTPHRHQERRAINTTIEVVHSFSAISKLVTRVDIDNAKNLSEDDAAELKERSAINLTAVVDDADYATEKWPITDISLAGLGGVIPKSAGLWVKIGDLCGLKPENSPHWWVGTIRRLHTDSTGIVHFGIEILAKKPLSVWLRTLGKGTENISAWESSSGSFDYDYLTVILLPDLNNSYANAMILMESGGYIPEAIYEVMLGEQSRNIKLTGLLEEGEDFEQISFTWMN